MKVSQRGVDLIKMFEGLVLEAYQDVAGVWTVGYGHTGPDVHPGLRISGRQAEDLLRRDLAAHETAVKRFTSVSLNQNEFDALTSFVYNIGAGAFQRSTACKRLNRNDRVGAADALCWWNKATVNGAQREILGLTRRRAAERALFLAPAAPPPVAAPDNFEENTRAVPVETPPRRAHVAQSRTVQGASVAGGAGVAATSLDGHGGATGGAQAGMLAMGEETAPAAAATSENDGDGATVHMDQDGEIVVDGAPETSAAEMTLAPAATPPAQEGPSVDPQIELALTVLMLVALLYVIYARIDDWSHYAR